MRSLDSGYVGIERRCTAEDLASEFGHRCVHGRCSQTGRLPAQPSIELLVERPVFSQPIHVEGRDLVHVCNLVDWRPCTVEHRAIEIHLADDGVLIRIDAARDGKEEDAATAHGVQAVASFTEDVLDLGHGGSAHVE